MRAAAAAWRSRSQSARVEAEPPVAWSPSRGSLYFARSGGAACIGDLVEAEIELLGHQHGRAGINALADLGMRRNEDDLAGGWHLDEGVRRERRGLRTGGVSPRAPLRKMQAEQQTAAGQQSRFQHQPPGRGFIAHRRLPQLAAAAWIAARMRT